MLNLFKLKRAWKKVTLVEMLIVLIMLFGILMYLRQWNINVDVKRLPLALPIGNNFQEISFKCPTDTWEMCNVLELCPLSFDGLEYFEGTVGASGEIDGNGRGWDLSKYPTLIDLSKFVTKGQAHKNWVMDADGNIKNTTSHQDILKTQTCRIYKTKTHDLKQFKNSLSKAMNETEPKMYLINGLLYNKHFQPISGAIDLMSGTMIVNGMVYFN